jgi:hypothetical protein
MNTRFNNLTDRKDWIPENMSAIALLDKVIENPIDFLLRRVKKAGLL